MNLWIGDSGSVFLNQKATAATLSRATNGHFIWHLGPRLMWSLSTRGFPIGICLVARLLHRIGARPGHVVPILISGGIDVRCHLASRLSDVASEFAFVADYVDNGRLLARRMGSESVIFVVPMPPGADWAVHKRLPFVGPLSDRLAAFAELRAALIQAVEETAGSPRAYVLDATDILADSCGQLDERLTADGCHPNREGALLVHGRLTELVQHMELGNTN